jgi:hypothetical protein
MPFALVVPFGEDLTHDIFACGYVMPFGKVSELCIQHNVSIELLCPEESETVVSSLL